jgi:hypothetical protein
VGDEELKPDRPMTSDEQALVDTLSEVALQKIDEALLANANRSWRKVAMLVGSTMMNDPDRGRGLPDVFYAQRIRKLVDAGCLESRGDLAYMRYSEVRLAPSAVGNDET